MLKFIFFFIILSSGFSVDKGVFLNSNLKEKQFLPQENFFNGFGCNGSNKIPTLHWGNFSANVKSFAIIAHDPDAPTGGMGWIHMIAYNIQASQNSISEENKNLFTFGKNDFGNYGFDGACPPVKEKHRYNFTVYGLDVEKLNLDANCSSALIGYIINVHTIDKKTISFFGKR